MSAPDFSSFPEVSKADWLQAVSAQLKRAPTYPEIEGVRLDPFAHPDDRPEAQPPIPVRARWTVSEPVTLGSDAKAANAQLLEGLNGGVQAPELIVGENVAEGELRQLLAEVAPAYVDLHWVASVSNADLLNRLSTVLNAGWSGTIYTSNLDEAWDWLTNPKPQLNVRLLGIATPERLGEELPVSQLTALVEATGHLFTEGIRKGFSPAHIAAQLHYRIPVGRQYLIEIAKLRALRILLAGAFTEHKLKNVPLPVLATYAHPAAYDDSNYTNMIRWGTITLASVVGGADRIIATGAPGSEALNIDFTQRIARNALHLLQLESGLAERHDPAAGSFYLEETTDRLVAAVLERLG